MNLESYLLKLSNKELISMIRFRTGNHYFPIETGRWENIDISERKCTLCNLNDVGDEFHFLLKCPFFESDRKTYIKKYYFCRPNMLKYKELLLSSSTIVLKNTSKFMQILMNTVSR